MAKVRGGRPRPLSSLMIRRQFHDAHLEKFNSDGKKAYTRPGSNKK